MYVSTTKSRRDSVVRRGNIVHSWTRPLNERCVSRLCLCEDNCRGGTKLSVKITCDVDNITF